MDEQDRATQNRAASSSGLRGRIAALRALRGLRGHVIRALIPAVALAVVAGGTAGAVTLVSLAGTEVTVGDGDGDGDTSGDTSGTSSDTSAVGAGPSGGDVSADDDAAPTSSSTAPSSDDGPDGDEADEDAADPAPVVLTFEEAVAKHGRPDYGAILTRRFPDARWGMTNNDYEKLRWYESNAEPQPTKAQLDAMWAEVAREMALEMDPKELARWAGTGDEIYVDGVLRPKGWVGGANDPQPEPPAITRSNCSIMPFLPNDGGGKTIDVWKDPTGAKNFEMVIGISYSELGFRIAEAHGFWGDQYCGVGFGVSGGRTFRWHSSQVNESIVVSILTSLGALPANPPATAPEPDPEPSPEPDPDPVEESAPEATEDDGTTESTEDGAGDGTGDTTGDTTDGGDSGTDPDADPDPDPADEDDEDTDALPEDDEDD